MSEKTQYVARTRIEYGPEVYLAGDPISLTAKEAEALLLVKAIALPTDAAADGAAATTVSDTALPGELETLRQELQNRDATLSDVLNELAAADAEKEKLESQLGELQLAQASAAELLQAAQAQATAAEAAKADAQAKAEALQAELERVSAVLTAAQIKSLSKST